MTAASGIVHEELHEKEWARHGGTLQAIQLWVNLPTSSKMSAPGYQTIRERCRFWLCSWDGEAGLLRVIAGSVGGAKGPAKTFTPIELYYLRLRAGHWLPLEIPNGHNVGLVYLASGQASVERSHRLTEAELAVFVTRGESR